MQITTIPFSHYHKIFIRWLQIFLTDTRTARCRCGEQHCTLKRKKKRGSRREEILFKTVKNCHMFYWGPNLRVAVKRVNRFWLVLTIYWCLNILPPSQFKDLVYWGHSLLWAAFHCGLFHQAELLCICVAVCFAPIHSPPEGNFTQQQTLHTFYGSALGHTFPSWSLWQ